MTTGNSKVFSLNDEIEPEIKTGHTGSTAELEGSAFVF